MMCLTEFYSVLKGDEMVALVLDLFIKHCLVTFSISSTPSSNCISIAMQLALLVNKLFYGNSFPIKCNTFNKSINAFLISYKSVTFMIIKEHANSNCGYH